MKDVAYSTKLMLCSLLLPWIYRKRRRSVQVTGRPIRTRSWRHPWWWRASSVSCQWDSTSLLADSRSWYNTARRSCWLWVYPSLILLLQYLYTEFSNVIRYTHWAVSILRSLHCLPSAFHSSSLSPPFYLLPTTEPDFPLTSPPNRKVQSLRSWTLPRVNSPFLTNTTHLMPWTGSTPSTPAWVVAGYHERTMKTRSWSPLLMTRWSASLPWLKYSTDCILWVSIPSVYQYDGVHCHQRLLSLLGLWSRCHLLFHLLLDAQIYGFHGILVWNYPPVTMYE